MARIGQGWRRSGAVVAALIGSVVFAVPASAHTPVWSVTCNKVTIDLTRYNPHVTNTVSVMVEGKDLLPPGTFGASFHTVLDLPAHSGQESVQLIVNAGDDPRYDVDQTKIAPMCQGMSAPPSTTPSPTPTPSVGATHSATAVNASAPKPSSASNLAETGGSSATPVIAGLAAAVLTAGAGLLIIGRKRRTGRH